MLKRITVLLVFMALIISCSTIMMSQDEKCKKADQLISMAGLVQNTNPKLTIKHTLDAIELCPNGVRYAYLSSVYLQMGKSEDALSASEIALRMEPNNPFVLDRAAFCYYGQARYNDAILLLGRSLSNQPTDFVAREMLARIYIVQRELRKGEDELLKNIRSNPNFSLSYYSLGKLYMDELSDYGKAHDYLDKYISMESNSNSFELKDAKKRIEILDSKMSETKK